MHPDPAIDFAGYHQSWQLIIKLAAHKNRKTKRCGYAFEAIKLDGDILFIGGANSGRKTQYLAVQEALVEAVLKAKDLRFWSIVIMSKYKRLAQICDHTSRPSWQEQALTSDLYQLQQLGLITHVLFVPKVAVLHVSELTIRVANYPGQFCYMY